MILLLAGLLFWPLAGKAQTSASAVLTPPQTDAFPRMDAYITLHDENGRFIHGLSESNFRILEDHTPLTPISVTEQRPGAQIVAVLNPGGSFATRNQRGISRYDIMVQTLQAWALSRQGSSLDDWSVLTTNGPEITHIDDPLNWMETLQMGQVDARSAAPSLDALFRAVDLAGDPTPRPGMGRAVLFITPPMEGEVQLSLENLASQAKQQNVRVFVWLVTARGAPESKFTASISSLAAQTGGKYFVYTGDEELPRLEEYFSPLRSSYQISYLSQIKGPGPHELVMEAQTVVGVITTPTLTFEFNVSPPDPAFISPSLEVQRKPIEKSSLAPAVDSGDEPAITYDLDEIALDILVDFPDRRARPLVRTALMVDGVQVAENREAPFDRFTWDLRPYTETGSHTLQVIAEDSLGLTGKSMETVVQVAVEQPASTPFNLIYINLPALVVLILVLGGAVALLVMILGGRLKPLPVGMRPRRQKPAPTATAAPAEAEAPAHRVAGWVNRLQWPQRHAAPAAPAYLVFITDSDVEPPAAPISIAADEMTLGSDPNLASLPLDDLSVEALHARLVRTQDGRFCLSDEGSVAGTWINYTPVPSEGALLEHGDLIHIGRVGLKFTLRQPARASKPVVTPVKARQEKQA